MSWWMVVSLFSREGKIHCRLQNSFLFLESWQDAKEKEKQANKEYWIFFAIKEYSKAKQSVFPFHLVSCSFGLAFHHKLG